MFFRSAAVLTIAVAGSAVAAQSPVAVPTPARDTLAPAVITATRVDIATVAPTSATTVIHGEELRARGITRVQDALRLVPGASLVSGGPIGSQSSLFLRGGNSNYVRVLVDGVPINDAGGAIDLANVTTDNLDRIEVVRGPASVLYGSDAVTGVIQLFTRGGKGPTALHGFIARGPRGTTNAELALSGGTAYAGYSVSGARHSTDGMLAFNNRYENDVLSASARLTPDSLTDARFAARWSGSTYHYPTDFDGTVNDHNAEQTEHRLTMSADGGRRLTERVDVRATIASNEFLPRSNDGPDTRGDTLGFYGFFSRSVRTRRSADVRLNARVGPHTTITLGSEAARDRERSSSLSLSEYGPDAGGFEAARQNTGWYAQAVGDATDRLSFALGARRDDNSAFGSFTTGRASVGIAASGSARLRVAVGTGFKAPSFFENFATGYVTGNAALKPERSESAELGLDLFAAGGDLAIRLTGFAQRFRDVIQYSSTAPSPGAPNYFNVAGASANGVEAEVSWRAAAATTLAATYAWTDTRVTEAGFDKTAGASYVRGERLLRRPSHTITVSADRTFGHGGNVHFAAVRVGERDDRDYAVFPVIALTLPAYTRIDVSAVIPLSGIRGLAVVARADNILGARYDEVAHFRAPGTIAFVGIRLER